LRRKLIADGWLMPAVAKKSHRSEFTEVVNDLRGDNDLTR
jgi:hypothetical protein